MQTLGVADGRDRHIEGLSGFNEGLQFSVDGNSRDVFQLQVEFWRNVDTQIGQHAFEALDRKRGLRGLIASAVQSNHQAITEQLVIAHPGDHRQVLDALGLGAGRRQQE